MATFEEYMDQDIVQAGASAPAFTIDSLEKANWALSKIARAEERIAKRKAFVESYMKRLQAWLEIENKSDLDTVDRLGGMMRPWADIEIAKGKAKHIDLLEGRVGFRTSPGRIQVNDEQTALDHLPDNCKRIKVEIDKVETKKLIERTGVVPDGVELVAGETRWYIEVKRDLPALP